MKRILSVLLALLMIFPFALACAESDETSFIQTPVEEDDMEGLFTPAIDVSLETYYKENGTLPDELEEALEPCDPFIPADVPLADPDDKAIIGHDDRVKIKNTKKYPYSAIGYMKVHASCGCSWTGTAFMISKQCAMTAGHCLVCTEHGGHADRFDIYFGYRKGGYVYHQKKGGQYWYGTDFYNGNGSYSYSGHEEWDYGFIVFNDKPGKTTGWFGFYAADDNTLNSNYYEVCGYRNGDMRKSYTDVSPISSNLIRHWADTKGGYSGCPVFDEDCYVVAINICHDSIANYARRITGDLIGKLRAANAF